MGTTHVPGDANLAEVRPGTVGELDGTALVGTGETLTVSAVGAEGEPERVLTTAVIHIGRDLGTPSLPVGEDAVETVGEHFRAVGTENNHRRELSAVRQRLHVLVDDVVVNGRADLSSRIGYETVQREDLTDRAADRRIGRQPRRRSRSRSDGRHGKKQPTGSLPAGCRQTRTKQAEATRQGIWVRCRPIPARAGCRVAASFPITAVGVYPRSSGLFGLRPSWSASSFVASPIGSLIRLPSGMPFGVLPTRSPSCTATLPTFAVARRRSLPWPARSSKTWSLSSAAVAVPTLWLRRSQWRCSQRLRTLAQVAAQVELRGPVKTPIFQVIAQEAAAMRDRGDHVSAIARKFGVDYHTADKAIRWYRQR